MIRLVFCLPVGLKPGTVSYLRLEASAPPGEVGQAQLALLPRAAQGIGVWPAEHSSLLAVQLPAMPASRLQAALAGALEDRLLGDWALQHLAAGPRDSDGSLRWAACCERSALRQSLRQLEQAGREVARVVPEAALLEPGWACLQRLQGQTLRLLWRDATGEAAWLHLQADADASACPAAPARLLVEPGLEDVARRWFGDDTALQPCDRAQWLARAADSPWDLRQFELAPRAAAQRLWGTLREQLGSPPWRRATWLAGLLAGLQLLGLNLHALQLSRQRTRLEAQLQATVSQALPGEPAVLDPTLQMNRALDQARQRVGEPTGDGLEVMMGEAVRVLGGARPLALDFARGRLELRLAPGLAQPAAMRCQARDLSCSVSGDTLRLQAAG